MPSKRCSTTDHLEQFCRIAYPGSYKLINYLKPVLEINFFVFPTEHSYPRTYFHSFSFLAFVFPSPMLCVYCLLRARFSSFPLVGFTCNDPVHGTCMKLSSMYFHRQLIGMAFTLIYTYVRLVASVYVYMSVDRVCNAEMYIICQP